MTSPRSIAYSHSAGVIHSSNASSTACCLSDMTLQFTTQSQIWSISRLSGAGQLSSRHGPFGTCSVAPTRKNVSLSYVCSSCLAHLALAAFRAICFRLLAESLPALALPPFNPPSRPSATAAGFFSACPITERTICVASSFGSFRPLLERFGIIPVWH